MRYGLAALLALPVLAAAAPAPDLGDGSARRTVESYYAAIERGDFRSAYLTWDGDGRASGKTYAKFRTGFASTAHSRVVAGAPVNGDSGMSQRWIEVPVDVYATLKNGRRQRFHGSYTLHRVVAGIGASPNQEQWYIASAKLVSSPR